MSRTTTDRSDPGINKDRGDGQNEAYIVLSDEERAKGFIRPVRKTYVHRKCGVATTMDMPIAETYARKPDFYNATFCCGCVDHFPVSEFEWEDGQEVGS